MADIRKYLSLERLAEYDALLKAKIAQDDAATLDAAKDYVDQKFDGHTHSWNDLEDKPFGEGGMTEITWDGDTTVNPDNYFQRYDLADGYGGFYRVSEQVPSNEQLRQGVIRIVIDGVESEYRINDIYLTSQNDAWAVIGTDDPDVRIIVSRVERLYEVFPVDEIKRIYGVGIYFENNLESVEKYVSYLSFPGGGVKTLDEIYIPDTIARKSDLDASITNITNGDIVVKEAEHATSADSATTADSATSAESATKATQDGNGAVIADTYETKADASAKLDEAKEYTDALKTYVGTIPEGATATDVVGYIQEKTSGIASEGAMTELSNRVGIVEGKVVTIEGDYLTSADKTELQTNIDTVSSAVELLTNGVDAETVDGVNDLIAYVNEHGAEVTGMKDDIKANADALAELAPVAKTGSWNDLNDKPFGEGGMTEITWDGDTTVNPDNAVVAFEDFTNDDLYTRHINYHVSDYVPTYEEFMAGSFVIATNETVNGNYENSYEIGTGIFDLNDVMGTTSNEILIVKNDNVEFDGVTYPKAGIYFNMVDDHMGGGRVNIIYTSSLTIPSGVKTLDEIYIPDTIARVADIPVVDLTPYETKEDASAKLTESKTYVDEKFDGHVHSWNELEDKPFGEGGMTEITWDGDYQSNSDNCYSFGQSRGYYYVSDLVLSYEDFESATVKDDMGSKYSIIDSARIDDSDDYIEVNCHPYYILVVKTDGYNHQGLANMRVGTYFSYEDTCHYVSLSIPGGVKTLDEIYIPDTIARTSDLATLESNLNTTISGKAAQGDLDSAVERLDALEAWHEEFEECTTEDINNLFV